jgi:hydroxymethylpyrimidine pyrophosphatase-like HAD family hydrolase/adenine/guanine phosphoribosyltransferase-like PRPP-binding protein
MLQDADFYRHYGDWLNIYPSMSVLLQRLVGELGRFGAETVSWRQREILTNVFLHCGAISDLTDDYLVGRAYDLSKIALLPFSAPAIRGFNTVMKASRWVRSKRLASVNRWRRAWEIAFQEFLRTSLVAESVPSAALIEELKRLAGQELPADLLAEVAKAPAAFRSQDLSHHDVLALGKRLLGAFQETERPILVIGLRTAGSYFAPLLAAYLQANGCRDVESVTLRPKKGMTAQEHAQIALAVKKHARAIIVDEPINTGSTLLKTLDLLRKSGFREGLCVVVPVHASRRDWNSGSGSHVLARHQIVTLDPEEWHKRSVMADHSVANLMREWLGSEDTLEVTVASDARSEEANHNIELLSEQKFHDRLKRVYRIDLRDSSGDVTTRYVLAKSVGWGWYGYHGILAAERLQGYVPRLIGFRDGVLFEEWAAQRQASIESDRAEFLQRAGAYVAERTRELRLDHNPVPALVADNRHRATDELSGALSNAYGSKPAAVLRRAMLRQKLAAKPCPAPTLIDGKMRPQEWVSSGGILIKTDFEHHGLGKTELNVIDPAYDLADAVLQWHLSEDEETQLLDNYIARSGDKQVTERLQLNKVLAGLYNMMSAVDNLNDARLAHQHEKFNRAYIDAFTFLVVQTTRFVGKLCQPQVQPQWQAPLVVMDIDGVLDKQTFGFHSTTAAGLRAISLLHSHNCALAVNTARSIAEVKEYCKAYQMVGGVAEYGAYVWDAISGREQVLISPESLRQLEIIACELRQIPGVFLNDDYRYSLRAFTYHKGVTVALPKLLIQNLISSLDLDQLTFHQTFLDSAVVAKDTDKGRGLLALLSLAGLSPNDVTAIGDSEPDLPMFGVAGRSYAPGHISCKQAARLLNCRIANGSYQLGLLDAAASIVHPDAHRCGKCAENEKLLSHTTDLFVQMLELADSGKVPELIKAMLSRKVLASLRQ